VIAGGDAPHPARSPANPDLHDRSLAGRHQSWCDSTAAIGLAVLRVVGVAFGVITSTRDAVGLGARSPSRA
jgi:hypothetical protein